MGNKVDTDALAASLEAELSAPASAPPAVPVQAAPVVAPVIPPPAPEVVPATPTPEAIAAEEKRKADELAANAEEDKSPERLRLTGLSEADRLLMRAARDLAKAKNIPLDQAFSQLSPAVKVAGPAPDPTPDPITALETELAEVQARLKQAADDNSIFDTSLRADLKKETDLERQIEKTKADKANVAATAAQTENQTWLQQWEASENWATTHFPDLAVPTSSLAQAVTAEVGTIGKNPNHPLFGNSQIPQLLCTKHAAELGIAPKAKTAPVVPPPVKATPSGFMPAPGGGSHNPPPLDSDAKKAHFQQREAQARKTGDADELYRLAEEDLTGVPVTGRATSAMRFR